MDQDPQQQRSSSGAVPMETEPSPMSDYDKIRAKRLAKMSAPGSSSSSTSQTSLSSSEIPAQSPPQPKRVAVVAPSPINAPKAAEAVRMDVDPQKSLVSPKPSPSVAANAKVVNQFMNVTDENWQHQTLAYIFQVELDMGTAEAKKYTLLTSMLEEFVNENLPLKFSSSNIDALIHARLSRPENADSSEPALFDYLIACWKRVQDVRRRVNQVLEKAESVVGKEGLSTVQDTVNRRLELVENARALTVSYSGLVVTPEMAEMFPQPAEALKQGAGIIVSKLVKDPFTAEDELPREFMNEFVQRFEGDGLQEIVIPVMNNVAAVMRNHNITTDYMAPIRALSTLLTYKPIALLITELPNWCPSSLTARTMEVLTILGPFLARSSVFPDPEGKIATTYFASSNPFGESGNVDNEGSSLGSRNYADVKSAQSSLRDMVATVQTALHNLFMTLIKTSPQSRDKVLDYI
ncbi:hypothetical protein HDU76_006628, partial [Blyttiomyces sp. JEL0837]